MILTVFEDAALFEYITQFQFGIYGDVKQLLETAKSKKIRLTLLGKGYTMEDAKNVVFYEAIMANNTQILRRFLNYFVRFEEIGFVTYFTQWHYPLVDIVVSTGNVEAMKFLESMTNMGSKYSSRSLKLAAANAHLAMVQYLESKPNINQWPKSVMDYASQSGSLELVRYLHTSRSEGCTVYAMDWAAHLGYFDIVKFLHEHRTEGCTTNAMDWAARSGHLDIVKYLHQYRSEGCTSHAMNGAAKNGYFNVVNFLHLHRTEGCISDAMDLAAKHGHLKIVKYLYVKGIKGF